jgi:hypothetical protein
MAHPNSEALTSCIAPSMDCPCPIPLKPTRLSNQLTPGKYSRLHGSFPVACYHSRLRRVYPKIWQSIGFVTSQGFVF